MMDVILPIEKTPCCQMYHNLAFPISVIQANAESNFIPWISQRFINCTFNPSSPMNKFSISLDDAWGLKEEICIYQKLQLEKKFIENNGISMIAIFQALLAKQMYIVGIHNEEYIPGKRTYKKEHFAHDFLLYGFDDSEQVFYSIGYLADQKYQRYTVSYDNMDNSMRFLDREKYNIMSYLYNPQAEISTDKAITLKRLTDYLEARPSLGAPRNNLSYGIASMYALLDYTLKNAEQKNTIDFRYIRGFMEHKYLLSLRVKHFLDIGWLGDFELRKEADEIYRLGQNVHLLALKYSMINSGSLLVSIRDSILEATERERIVLSKIIKALTEGE